MRNTPHTYIIGEIGQNHNGSVEMAKQLVEMASRPIHDALFDIELSKIDAIKMTKRDLGQELSKSAMSTTYLSEHSFGKTYGEHRAYLELTNEEHFEVYTYAQSKGLDFVETLCAITCLDLLNLFEPDYLKVASRDLTNLPLLEAMAETKIPIILSTGMADEKDLHRAVEIISKKHDDLSILHCVSEYPTHPANVNLRSINRIKKLYGEHYKVGYSDHTIGISASVAAIAMGAQIIEKHITLDRSLKGTDQKGSLAPDGLFRMIRDIRLMELSLGEEEIFVSPSVKESRIKLERSIATKRTIKAGEAILDKDLFLLSPGDGIAWKDLHLVVNKIAKQDIPAHEIIYPSMLKTL